MAKDRTGKYHPPKGKPSGAGKEEGLGLHPTDPDKLEQYLDITDKYTTDADQLAEHVPLRHPNRNTEKGKNKFENLQDRQTVSNEELAFKDGRTQVVPEEIPGRISRELFTELANYHGDVCISIYLPTHNAGVEVNEQFDPIKFKNVMQDIVTTLKGRGLNQAQIEDLLEPGYDLMYQNEFWLKQSPGLAVFISNGYFKFMRMPLRPDQEVLINSSFYVTPLIPIMTTTEYFYTAVISKKQVKLFRVDAFGMEFIPVGGIPEGIGDAQAEDKDDETTFRIGGLKGSGAASYHGHGGGNNHDDKGLLEVFLEEADDMIWKQVLHTENVPLLLAGVEYLIPVYKSVTDYNNIWEVPLTGSHEHEDNATLYPKLMEIMKPYFQQKVQKVLEDYGNKSATTLSSSDIKEVVPGAYYSRVAHLLVQRGAHLWGTFDEASNELRIHDTQQADSEDLVDHAVMKTILTGGNVYLLDKEQMPVESPLAAVLRY